MDVIANVHTFSSAVGTNAFDMILTIATYEHMSRPWIATKEIASTLNPGGWLYIRTHQTFPLHGRGRKRGAEAQAIGCSRGGRTTKIHAIVDALGRPIAIDVTPGHRGDVRAAAALISSVPPGASVWPMLCEDAGLKALETAYEYPVSIVSFFIRRDRLRQLICMSNR